MRYKTVQSGEWVQPRRKAYYMQCCGCGLAHRLQFRLMKWGNGRKIQFRAYRTDGK